MEKENICKFSSSFSDDIQCQAFVYETRVALSSEGGKNYLILVTQGKGFLDVAGNRHELSEGSLCVVSKKYPFSVETEDGTEYMYIVFIGRRADVLVERSGAEKEYCVFSGFSFLKPFWSDCLEKARDDTVDLFAEAALMYSFAHLRQFKKLYDDLTSKMVRITGENFTDPDFGLSSLSSALSYDPKYLSSVFKKKIGVPFTKYLKNLRVSHAVFLMEQGLESVRSISVLSGFEDPLYFSKVFKECRGESPKRFIEKIVKK